MEQGELPDSRELRALGIYSLSLPVALYIMSG
jgi:hypothetical protein